MRIAFLAGHLSHRASGVRQIIEGLSGAIAAQGVDVKVFGIRDAAWTAGDDVQWQGAPAEAFDRIGPGNFGYMPELGRALQDFAPDVVHLHGIWMYSSHVAAKWASRPGKTAPRKLVISPHGMLAPAALAYSPQRKRLVRLAFQNRCFAKASGYLATAQSEAEDIRAYLGDVPVGIVPNGIRDTQAKLPLWHARDRKVVAIGRLHPVKGYDRLLKAWAKVEAVNADWSLEIAGPDPDGHGDELRRLASSLGVRRAVIGPARYGAERDEMIAAARVFALPSLTENFALTVPEALTCGTPVVASTGAPWQGLVDHGCGWWVAPEPDALAQAMLAAIACPDNELEAMGIAGRNWVQNAFGWDGLAKQTITFYDSLHCGEETK